MGTVLLNQIGRSGLAVRSEEESKSFAGWALLLVALTFGLFARSASFEFVNYDDPDYVTENARVHDGLTISGVQWAFTTRHAGNWHPVTWLSHIADWQLFGRRAGLHHLVNALFHSVNAGLLFMALWRLTRRPLASLVVAALFAFHPAHVESVAWVAQRKDVLSAFWMFAGLLAYERYIRARAGNLPLRAAATPYVALILCATMGILSKPTAIVFPLYLLILDYWPLNRLRNPGLWACVKEKLPLLVLSFGGVAMTLMAQRANISEGLGMEIRASSAWVSYTTYLGTLFWPMKLAVLYPHPGAWPWVQVLPCAALIVLLTSAFAIARAGRQYLLAGWMWYVLGLLPVVGLVQVGAQYMADRYLYVPSVGIFVALVWGVASCVREHRRLRSVTVLATILAVVSCAVLSWRQLGYWRNSGALFTHALQVTRGNYVALNNLGHYYFQHGDSARALDLFEEALRVNPQFPDALNNAGMVLYRQGRHPAARDLLLRALQLDPLLVEAHLNLGRVEQALGRMETARELFLRALEIRPGYEPAARALQALGG